MRATFADAQNSNIPDAIGICGTDPRFLKILNESVQRLIVTGKWHNTLARYRFCAIDGCITYPPQIASVEAVAVCGWPMKIRTMLYEFLENGWGIQNSINQVSVTTSTGSCCGQGAGSCGVPGAIFRGRFPTFADIIGTDKRIQLVCDRSSDVGKPVLCLGYDPNQNWIRTIQNGTMQDGEVINLSQSPGTASQNLFGTVTDLQPPDNLDGQWWLYELSTTTAATRLIGQYEYFVTRPNMARYFFPSILGGQQSNPPSNTSCVQTLVDAAVKLDYMPVRNPSDYLLIGNLPALGEMMSAVKKANNESDSIKKNQIILSGLAVAKSILQDELDHYQGSGARIGLNIEGACLDGCPVENLV